MSVRALVIGIENYPRSGDLAKTITGATKAAEDFCGWLTGPKKVAAKDLFICAEGGKFPIGAHRYGTQRERVLDAIADLVKEGQDTTEEMYFFFSGHGYCYQQSAEKRALDILVASDFVNAADSGVCCIKLTEVQDKLRAILGGRQHYYFIDACRTLITEQDIDPIGLGRKLGRLTTRKPTTKYSLFSTAYGYPANINSDFAPLLIKGLKGEGRAKGYWPDGSGSLQVRFPFVHKFVQERLSGQKVDPVVDGEDDGIILEIQPIPQFQCTILVRDAGPADQFEARLSPNGKPQFAQSLPFVGPALSIPHPPDDLMLQVIYQGKPLTRVTPGPNERLDFFEDSSAVFEKWEAPVRLNPADIRFIVNPSEGFRSFGPKPLRYPAMPVANEVAPHQNPAPASPRAPIGPVRESIVRMLGGNPLSGTVEFSETLGVVADLDLSLWLTIIGTSRILRPRATFSKLQRFALHDFTGMRPGDCGVYVLSALESYSKVRVKVADSWIDVKPVSDLDSVWQGFTFQPSGSLLISVQLDSMEPRTFAGFCVPNRVTFVVFAEDERGKLTTRQFVIPVHHLFPALPQFVFDRLRADTSPLRAVRTLHMFQKQFALGRPLAPPDPIERGILNDLLCGKWVDPVMSLFASYDIIRRGNEPERQMVRAEVVPNLETFFPGIPDTAAISVMLGDARPMPGAPPLLLDGLAAFPDWEDNLPLPSRKLDYGGLWTKWKGAVARQE